MNEQGTSYPRAGYRSQMQPRRPARSASPPAPRPRAVDHKAAPTDLPLAAESTRTAASRTSAPRRPTRRRIDEYIQQFDAEHRYSDIDPGRDHRWRTPVREPVDDLETLEEDEFVEPELCEPTDELRVPTIRDAGSLPPTLSIVQAGEWLGIGRTVAYGLARKGAFPVRTIRVGNQHRVITAELLAMLGIPLAR